MKSVVVGNIRVLKLRVQGVVKSVVAGSGPFKCGQGQGLDGAVQLGAEVKIHLPPQLLAAARVDGRFLVDDQAKVFHQLVVFVLEESKVVAAAVPDTKDFTLLQGVLLALVNDIDEGLIAVLVQLNPVSFRLAVDLQAHFSLLKVLRAAVHPAAHGRVRGLDATRGWRKGAAKQHHGQ